MLDDVKMKEVDDDMKDLELDNVGKELDNPERGMNKGFKKGHVSLVDQIHTLLDRDDVTTLTTQDGKKHKVTNLQAATIKEFLTANYDSRIKMQFSRDIQDSETMIEILKGQTVDEMRAIFMDKYKPKARAASNYS